MKHAQECQFSKLTLWVAVQDFTGTYKMDPLDHILPVLQKHTDVARLFILDSDSEPLQLTSIPSEKKKG